jgi:formylglycine-generating enzyme required for sulfatase activity
MTFTLIPAGQFLMGSSPDTLEYFPSDSGNPAIIDRELPKHSVRLTNPFYLGTYEVTQQQYQSVMRTNPSSFSSTGERKKQVVDEDTARYPVESVTWWEASSFCDRLSSSPTELAARRSYRLPTEAEWEFACRAGTTTLWSCGGDDHALMQYAWCNQGVLTKPHPIGAKKPNPFGLYDMHGNVDEFCLDWYAKDAYSASRAIDPMGPVAADFKVARGGGYLNSAVGSRSASRHQAAPMTRAPERGFRVVCVIHVADQGTPGNSTATGSSSAPQQTDSLE